MFGFLIGTACLVGLIKTVRHGYGWRSCGYGGRWGHHGGHWGHHGGHHGGHGGHWGRGGGRWGGRWGGGFGRGYMLRHLFERLDTTPGQEKVILAALEEVQKSSSKLWEELEKSRADLARSMKGEHFDQAAVREMFSRHDATLEEIRKIVSAEMAKVHEALDEKQRAEVADLFEHGLWGGGRGGPRGWGRWHRGGGNDAPGQYV